MARYDVHGSETVWRGKLSTARVDEVEMADGSTASREVVAHLDAVAVVALTNSDEVVLVRQYRHPVGSYQWEIPAGLLDAEGEDPSDAAARELAEETGMRVAGLQEIVRFANSSGWTDEHTTIFAGEGAAPHPEADDFEAIHEEADMEVATMPFREALRMAREGRLTDAKTLIGILAVAARRADGAR